jgi:hypothetical protein
MSMHYTWKGNQEEEEDGDDGLAAVAHFLISQGMLKPK